jgi:hypothetical protein
MFPVSTFDNWQGLIVGGQSSLFFCEIIPQYSTQFFYNISSNSF